MPVTFQPQPFAYRVSRMLGRAPRVQTTIPGAHGIGRIGRDMGGAIPDSPTTPFSGPIASIVAGRTDHVPMHVQSGAYVIPADIVSSIGQGNSLNGLAVLRGMFKASPYDASSGPWGSQMPQAGSGAPGMGSPMPRRAAVQAPYPAFADQAAKPHLAAKGGSQGVSGEPTPIMAAGGEFVIHPDDVARVGGGDVKKGHQVLDHWVLGLRKEAIKTLQKLPGPAK